MLTRHAAQAQTNDLYTTTTFALSPSTHDEPEYTVSFKSGRQPNSEDDSKVIWEEDLNFLYRVYEEIDALNQETGQHIKAQIEEHLKEMPIQNLLRLKPENPLPTETDQQSVQLYCQTIQILQKCQDIIVLQNNGQNYLAFEGNNGPVLWEASNEAINNFKERNNFIEKLKQKQKIAQGSGSLGQITAEILFLYRKFVGQARSIRPNLECKLQKYIKAKAEDQSLLAMMKEMRKIVKKSHKKKKKSCRGK